MLPLLEGDDVALTDTEVDFDLRGVDVADDVCVSITDSVRLDDLVAVIDEYTDCEMALVLVALMVFVPPADLVIRVVLVTMVEADADE